MTIKKLTGQLVFVQLDTPKPCFDVEKGKEWKSSITVTEDDADEWDNAYPKQSAKQVKTTEYEKTYKVKPPFPDQRKQYIVTLRKNTKLANGEPVPSKYTPKVFIERGKTLVDETNTTLVANGSMGQISVDHYDAKLGPVARLKNVKVVDLIEYVKQDSDYEAGSEFDDDNADDGNGGNVKVPAKAKTTVAKPTKVEKVEKPKSKPSSGFDDMDDDIPF